MTLPLLATKFNIPPAGAKIVPRPRLLRLLDRSLEQHAALILICGPAGYGKTTLASEWLRTSKAIQPDRVAWLTLERSDNDPTRFLTYFLTALQRIQPDMGASVLKLLQTHKPLKVQVLGTVLVNELNEIDRHFTLVLDDYHLLTVEPILDFMVFLVEHQPPCMNLVLVTRADPALPLARLRGRGQLVELRQQALRFLPEEVAEFTNQVMALPLSPAQVSYLAARTEGWVSGLQLAAVSLRAGQDPAVFFQDFSGEHEFVADYLTEEVLSHLPERTRSFLLQTSLLERMSAPLCEAVTGQSEAQATLEKLVDANLFVVPLDSQHAWYRYHSLFSDLLRKRLQSSQAAMMGELHKRASLWFQQNGAPDQAIEHAIAGGDYERSALLIEAVAERLLMQGEAASLLRWLEALPDEQVLAQPVLGSLYGIAQVLSARPIQQVASLVEKMTASGNLAGFQGEMDLLQALLAVYRGDALRAIQLSEQALQRLPPERPFFRSLAADTLGIGHTLVWDIPAATRAFEQVVAIASGSNNGMMTIMALTNLAGLSYAQGHLRAAINTCYQILENAKQQFGSQTPMVGKTLFNLGEMLREQGDLARALSYLLEAARMMGTFSDVGQPLANLAVARIYIHQRDWQAAQTYIDRARRQAQATQPVLMDDQLVDLMQARFQLARGDLDQAAQWAHSRGWLDRPLAEIFAEASQNMATFEVFQVESLVVVRLLLAQSNFERALAIIARLQDILEKRKNQRRLIEVLVLKALALHQKGELDLAVKTLATAISQAEPEGYLRTFVDEGEPMARLLYQAAIRGISPTYIHKLLAVLAGEAQSHGPAGQPVGEALMEPLSAREMEVLGLMAEGLTNGEIAKRLYISLSTVKGHTSNIYSKLSVKNRTQAVTQARSLGLLPPV